MQLSKVLSLIAASAALLVSCAKESSDVSAQSTVPWEARGGAAELIKGVNYLSDLDAHYAYNGFGPLERDMSNGEAEAGDGQTLTIGGQTYEKGLGMHPAEGERTWAEVSYTLAGQCDTFSAEVGLDDEIDTQSEYGSVYFQVFADDQKLWQSERLTGTDEAVATGSLAISSADKLKLVVINAGDDNWYDHADWADAKVRCSDAQPDPEPTTPSPNLPVRVRYSVDNTDFPNPERGFHDGVELVGGTDFAYVRERGYTLARSYVRLDDYRNKLLDEAFLSQLGRGLEAARAAGIKVIPRFSYNFPTGGDDGDYQGASEAPIDLALQHIQQLEPLYRDYADVIAVHPAGFVGAWGEWHSSGPEQLDSPENKAKILGALLDALPESVTLQLRYPGDLLNLYPQVLTVGEAFSGSDKARVGHHNDCFLANETDAGTYRPEEQSDTFKRYLEALTQVTPMGGETCEVSLEGQRTDCGTALAELERFHWDYLNINFYALTVERWKEEGCFEEISKRLGYRYQLTETSASADSLRAEETLRLELEMRNRGFGKLYNPRPTELVFVERGGDAQYTVTLAQDARDLLPLPGETETIPVAAALPAGLASGTYDLFLKLPDASPELRTRSEYSIRLANQDSWDSQTGMNALNLSVQIQ